MDINIQIDLETVLSNALSPPASAGQGPAAMRSVTVIIQLRTAATAAATSAVLAASLGRHVTKAVLLLGRNLRSSLTRASRHALAGAARPARAVIVRYGRRVRSARLSEAATRAQAQRFTALSMRALDVLIET
jgi:hypothetical protein